MTPAVSRRYLTPRDIASDLGCNLSKVLAWIKAGELRAVNIAVRADSRKPRWRIAALGRTTRSQAGGTNHLDHRARQRQEQTRPVHRPALR